MIDWRIEAKSPLDTLDAYRLLGHMLDAKATWREAAAAFQARFSNEMETIDMETGGELPKHERRMIVIGHQMRMKELEQMFRPWLETDLDLS